MDSRGGSQCSTYFQVALCSVPEIHNGHRPHIGFKPSSYMYGLKRWLVRILEVTRTAVFSSVQHFAPYQNFIDGKFRRQLPIGNPNICEDNLAIVHQSVEHPAIKAAFDSVSETLQSILLQKVTRIRKDEPTVEFGLETAASIDLLNLVNASIHGLEEIGERARLRVTLLEEGQKKVNEGKHILFSAISEIPKRIK
ncbi:hypothetical protein TEA_009755 [Camellia sinensis var. sinensis]|uniref:Uncharacterized protein n=1 Tax=Camellia sinensis var. sinensis TaxID=542762 RepID=A0A4S4DKU5_CAMSN|nr:hypothetical protein TEA_009755 [Camellia sinensis var. sinensis]